MTALEEARKRTDPRAQVMVRAITNSLRQADLELRFESAGIKSDADVDSARAEIERVDITYDCERADMAFDFYITRAAYNSLLKTSGREAAEKYLAEQKDVTQELKGHIRRGTTPEF